jgi:hypothetical protein
MRQQTSVGGFFSAPVGSYNNDTSSNGITQHYNSNSSPYSYNTSSIPHTYRNNSSPNNNNNHNLIKSSTSPGGVGLRYQLEDYQIKAERLARYEHTNEFNFESI